MWTTCPQCRGSGFESVMENGRLVHEDECTLCNGDGGIAVEFEEDEDPSEPSVDVQDED